jgi:hypothetical protein
MWLYYVIIYALRLIVDFFLGYFAGAQKRRKVSLAFPISALSDTAGKFQNSLFNVTV